jgi:hypothetical protein
MRCTRSCETATFPVNRHFDEDAELRAQRFPTAARSRRRDPCRIVVGSSNKAHLTVVITLTIQLEQLVKLLGLNKKPQVLLRLDEIFEGKVKLGGIRN